MISDEVYIDLKKLESKGHKLSHAERNYVDKMEQLEYMCDFRPDWFPEEYKNKMINKLQNNFCRDVNLGNKNND